MSDATDPPFPEPGDGAVDPALSPTKAEGLFDLGSASAAERDALPTPEELQRGFPQFEILELLGRGGMGAVYKARQKELDRFVALKLLPPALGDDPDFTARFRREARAMARLNHPHIITVHNFGQTAEGRLYFVMEFVDGANLHDLIRAGSLDAAQALAITAQVCDALAYAHGEGIVHRDIKPANVMVDFRGRAKVADFGLARLIGSEVESGLTQTGTVMGTLDYMAPEQRRGEHVDHRADIYALGVMFYEMLCREVPHGMFDPPSTRIGCDPRLDRIVATAMQSEPDRRFQSTQEMHAAVEAARSAVLVPAPAPPRVVAVRPPRPPAVAKPAQPLALPPPAKSRTPLYAGIVAAVLLLISGGIYFVKTKPRPSDLSSTRLATPPPVTLEPTAIKLWDTEAKVRAAAPNSKPPSQWVDQSMWLDGNTAVLARIAARDLVVRASIRMNPDAKAPQVAIRFKKQSGDSTGLSDEGYSLGVFPDSGALNFRSVSPGKNTKSLRDFPLRRSYGPDEWIRVEIRASGDEFTIVTDGEVLGTVHDTTHPEAGGIQVFATANGYFRDIVYVPLDKPEQAGTKEK